MAIEYYEDVKLHDKMRSREYHLTEQEIIDFARVWEPRPVHVDPGFGNNSQFGSVIATGNHVVSIMWRLGYEISCEKTPATAAIAALGVDDLRFESPARPGDTVVGEQEVISKRESKSNANAGIVIYANTLVNQRDEVLLRCVIPMLVEKRHKA